MNERATTKVNSYIGRRMREQRKKAGVSQQYVADILGVSFQQIQKSEKGTNRISAARLYNLARAFEQPITVFLP